MEIFLIFVLGLCFGSFITMASHRLPRQMNIVRTRSHCPRCTTNLGIADLFPLFSWMATAGKCRHCRASISWRYPLTELFCAGLFILLYLTYGLSQQFVLLALFTAALLTLLVADLETGLIPDEIHFFLLPLGIGYHWLNASDPISVALCAGAGLGMGLLLHYGYFWLRGRHGLGFGDVKFLLVAGLWLGEIHQLVVFIFLSGVLGIMTGIFWRLITREPRFPFGPALAVSLFILVCYPNSSDWFWQSLSALLLK